MQKSLKDEPLKEEPSDDQNKNSRSSDVWVKISDEKLNKHSSSIGDVAHNSPQVIIHVFTWFNFLFLIQ